MRYLSVALLFVATTAMAQDWQEIAMLDSRGGALLVDASDIVEVKGYRRAWFKWAYATDQPVPSEYREAVPKARRYRWVESAHLFHCAEQTTALASQRWFNSRDRELGSRRSEALNFIKVSPGSVEQQMLAAACGPQSVRSLEIVESQASMISAPQPKAYYPKGAMRRGEQGSATVKVCVDSTGKLLREPEVTVSSGFQEIDGAAIEVAKDSRYRPGVRDGAALPESCLEVPVTFRQAKGSPESATAQAEVVKPASPYDYYPPQARGRRRGAPVVQACVGRNGKLVRDPVILQSSGFSDLDAAAIEVARATEYAPGRIDGAAAPESCIKFKVQF